MKPVLPVTNLVMIGQANTLKRRAKKEAIRRVNAGDHPGRAQSSLAVVPFTRCLASELCRRKYSASCRLHE
jgi:hypothetical protein